MSADFEDLWLNFLNPPDRARPRAWWHWMDGNVDPEGIRLDLEWLHRVGVRGVHMFDGAMGTPLVVSHPVVHGTAAWRTAVDTAFEHAHRLGMEVATATSPGWSAAGGPWVPIQDAMKKVVWSETIVEGGTHVEKVLPALPDVAGPYQDCANWGGNRAADRFVEQTVVVAVAAEAWQEPLVPTRVEASSPISRPSVLTDRNLSSYVELPRDPETVSTCWLQQAFDRPVTVSAVTLAFPGPRGFGAAPPPRVTLEASDDGHTYTTVADIAPTTLAAATIAFQPVTARTFRLTLTGGPASAGLPALAEGVRPPPVRSAADFLVAQFALWTGGRVSYAEAKAGFGVLDDYYEAEYHPEQHGDQGLTTAASIDPASVVDITEWVDADGRLDWRVPPGRWRIIRFGASLTGKTNGPALPAATGLEVDKLDAEAVQRYFDVYLSHFPHSHGSRSAGGLSALLSDSIESGPQNWTPQFLRHFEARIGYDPRPWLPALAGYVVDSHAASDAFLWDWRRTITDLLAANYYGTVGGIALSRELLYYAEALEDHRPQLGDDLAMRAAADVPMGAMWTYDPDPGPLPTYVADLKGASSVAHVYDKPYTGAESFSAFYRPWSYTPRQLKPVADLELALGVTRFCLHTSPHQPSSVPPPGISLSPYLGQTFVRTETWAEQAGEWVDYLARCAYLLNLGEPAVDIAYFVGEEGPVTALFGDRLESQVPRGFDYDFVNLDALRDRFAVEDGTLIAGQSRYQALYLGGSSRRMTISALQRIAELVNAGATVIGERPVGSPSLADDPADHQRLVHDLWDGVAKGHGSRINSGSLGAVLSDLGVVPFCRVDPPDARVISRNVNGKRISFIANPKPASIRTVVEVAENWSPLAAWDPVERRRWPLKSDTGLEPGRQYSFELPAFGSIFLVPDPNADGPGDGGPVIEIVGQWTLEVPARPGLISLQEPRPWTDFSELVGFSGSAVYRASFTIPELDGDGIRASLVLEDVGDVAQIVLNGRACGVAWTPPFRVDVSTAVQSGMNQLEITVTNSWMNRLIAEAGSVSGELFAPATEVYTPDATPRISGLAGPVRLQLAATTSSSTSRSPSTP